MKYDFTSIINRTGNDALAVETIPVKDAFIKEGFSRIPMWVADMNFATAASVQEHIMKRIAHPIYGYYYYTDEYYNSIINWQKEQNGVTHLVPEDIGYENGVLGCIASALQAFTAPGESVLLHAPTYPGFCNIIKQNGRTMILSELKKDDMGIWRMDYHDMDRKLKEHKIHFAIICSPHNPCGRVWEKEELEKAMDIYRNNDCIVVSDEIWSDLTLEGVRHIPTQSISEDARSRTIAVYSPTKTFNMAGLLASYHIVYHPFLRDRLRKQSELSRYNLMNVLSMHGLIGAYSREGREWLSELRQVLSANVDYSLHFIREHFHGVEVSRPQGTYLIYLDCSKWLKEHNCTLDDLLLAGIKVGVIWQDGRSFKIPDTIRMNLALPRALLEEAFDRLKKYVF